MARKQSVWFKNIFAAYGFSLAWIFFASFVFPAPPASEIFPAGQSAGAAGGTAINELLTRVCLFAPLTEELAFRMVGVGVPLAIFGRSHPAVWLIAAIGSAIFGYLHGNLLNLPYQGVLGLVLAWTYIRNACLVGASDVGGILSGFLSSALVHAMYNFTMLVMAVDMT